MNNENQTIMNSDDFSILARKRDDLISQAHLIDQEIQRYKIKVKKEREEKAERVLGILAKNRLSIDDLEHIINRAGRVPFPHGELIDLQNRVFLHSFQSISPWVHRAGGWFLLNLGFLCRVGNLHNMRQLWKRPRWR